MGKDKTINQEDKFNYFRPIRRIALIFFIGFSIYLFVSTLMLIFLTKPQKEVKLPDVTGKRFMDVYNGLIRKGIKPEIKYRDVFDLDDGVIISQYPEYGRIVAEDSTLKLTVSRSSLYVDVPNLAGVELPVAVNKIKNIHYHDKTVSLLIGVISYMPSDKTPQNVIIEQNPGPGEKIKPDTRINLLVSSGNTPVDAAMPNVTEQSIELCYDLLLAKGVQINEEITETGNIRESGLIAAQTPAKDSPLKKGDLVTLKVRHYPLNEHPYVAYEKVLYRIPDDSAQGLYEAVIDDNRSKRIRFSKNMKPGQKIEFVFQRVGNSKVSILCNKKKIRVIGIDVE